MGDFFKSTRAKVLGAILIVLLAFMLRAAATGGMSTLTSSVLGAIISPIQKLSSNISGAATGFFGQFLNAGEISKENEQLKEENRQLLEQLADFEKYKLENENLKEFLDVKEQNPDFVFETASVIGRSPNEHFYSFTIDKGSLDNVSPNDPVITKDGLVGVVTTVGMTSSKVVTILDVARNTACFVSRTKDTGIITGDIALAEKGLCKLTYLSRESAAAKGDLVQTTGISGIYPKGLLIGKIQEVHNETHGKTLYAIVEPVADIRNVKDVLVITSFRGQGSDSVGLDDGSSSGTQSPKQEASAAE